MGIVYRAYDRRVKRDVAVKTLRDKPEPEALQLFQRECDVLASISHPNIVEIFDIGEFQDGADLKPYFVMPLLRGATLDKIRAKIRRPPDARAAARDRVANLPRIAGRARARADTP